MISTKRRSKPSERNRREESEDRLPEIRTAREDKTVEVISGTHGIDDDIREGTRIEAFDLDMLAEGSQVAIGTAQFGGGAVGVLRRRNGGDFGFGMFAELRFLHTHQTHTFILILILILDRSNGFICTAIYLFIVINNLLLLLLSIHCVWLFLADSVQRSVVIESL